MKTPLIIKEAAFGGAGMGIRKVLPSIGARKAFPSAGKSIGKAIDKAAVPSTFDKLNVIGKKIMKRSTMGPFAGTSTYRPMISNI